MSLQTLRIRLSGIVQGVGFRRWAWTQAQRLGVRGWVRNLPDDRVEVMAQADAQTMERFLALLREGPRFAQVDELETESVEESRLYGGFEVY